MTPKNQKRAMSRRSRQNKNPAGLHDLLTGNSRIPQTKLWSVNAEHKPAYTTAMRNDNNPYHIVQTVDKGTVLTTSAGADTFYSQNFVLTDLDQVASFQNIFDQYRLACIEVWLTPTYQNTSGGASNSRYLTVVDYDDSATLSGTANARQYENCTDTTSQEGVYRRFRPHCTFITSSGNSTSTTGNATAPSLWINSGSGTVPHYGFKVAAYAASVTTTFNLVIRYHVEFRNVF